jgi:3-deoxy-D-manno-octulosonic-acid transferase
MLTYVKHFFVQNEESKNLLSHLGFQNTSLAGDTRFDRVAALSKHPKKIQEVADFCEDSKVLVAGSTWPEDEARLAELLLQHPDWKLILAPHEVSSGNIEHLCDLLPSGAWLKLSELMSPESKVNSQKSIENSRLKTEDYKVLIVDTIGLLSSLYAYGDIAYIGGGFGKGIHNTLEAATYGVPIIFGPNYQKFQEAKDLISEGAGFSIANAGELTDTFQQLTDADYRKKAGTAAKHYVQSRVGATEIILKQLLK